MARIKMKEFASRVSTNANEDIGDTKKFIRAVFEELTKEDPKNVFGSIAEYAKKMKNAPKTKTTKKTKTV